MKTKKPSQYSGNIVDVLNSRIFPGRIAVLGGKIIEIQEENKRCNNYIIPGFVDSHIHIESSMLVPSEFARLAAIHGTIATVSDPHEIGNVLGAKGVNYMIENGKKTPLKFFFGAPSCVPATAFETSGAVIGVKDVEALLKREEIKYLSEVMNYPGVINNDPEVMAKIRLAKKYNKKIDGHAPGLSGSDLRKYVRAGISTDHECFTEEEAREKLGLGMIVQIREGSAAKNFEELSFALDEYSEQCMLCSDDKHPDDLACGHINELVKRAVAKDIDVMKVLRAACVNPVKHYGLGVGLLQEGDSADFLIVDNLKNFGVEKNIIGGLVVAEKGRSRIKKTFAKKINRFNAKLKKPADFSIKNKGGIVNIIEAVNGQLITNKLSATPLVRGGNVVSDAKRDFLKITVVNRYLNASPAVGLIKNFGLRKGAIASSVAHDSHNIVAVGVSDEDICRAVNVVIKNNGGLAYANGGEKSSLQLPIAGLMTDNYWRKTAEKYSFLQKKTKKAGTKLASPYMALSFMALLVIPKLKISDKGLFDSEKFKPISLFE